MTVSRLLSLPPAFAYDAVMEAIGNGMRLILIITERIPRHDVAKGVVMWGEPGTNYEEEVAGFIKEGGFTKPLVAYIAGRFVEEMPEGTVFGHAASIIEGGVGRPSNKMEKLRDAGCYVADNFNDIIQILQEVMVR